MTEAIIAAQRTEISRLEKWVADMQAGCYVNCVYCGHRYGPDDETPVAMADVLKAHIAVCPKHPMAALLKVARSSTAMFARFQLATIERTGAPDRAVLKLLRQIDAAIAQGEGKGDPDGPAP